MKETFRITHRLSAWTAGVLCPRARALREQRPKRRTVNDRDKANSQLSVPRLARGVRVIQEALAIDDPSVIVKSYETGFSANMCEDFAALVEETSPAGLGFSFTFSPEWPAESFREAFIGRQHIEIARSAAKSMRETVVARPETVFGRITRLENESDPTDLFDVTHDREIVVNWESEDGDLKARISLEANDYLIAAQAHLSGRPVQVSGNLKREGRRWVLDNRTGLTQY